jgi:hypothetical protein
MGARGDNYGTGTYMRGNCCSGPGGVGLFAVKFDVHTAVLFFKEFYRSTISVE